MEYNLFTVARYKLFYMIDVEQDKERLKWLNEILYHVDMMVFADDEEIESHYHDASNIAKAQGYTEMVEILDALHEKLLSEERVEWE